MAVTKKVKKDIEGIELSAADDPVTLKYLSHGNELKQNVCLLVRKNVFIQVLCAKVTQNSCHNLKWAWTQEKHPISVTFNI